MHDSIPYCAFNVPDTYFVQCLEEMRVAIGNAPLVSVSFHMKFVNYDRNFGQFLCSWSRIFPGTLLGKLTQVTAIVITYEF